MTELEELDSDELDETLDSELERLLADDELEDEEDERLDETEDNELSDDWLLRLELELDKELMLDRELTLERELRLLADDDKLLAELAELGLETLLRLDCELSELRLDSELKDDEILDTEELDTIGRA